MTRRMPVSHTMLELRLQASIMARWPRRFNLNFLANSGWDLPKAGLETSPILSKSIEPSTNVSIKPGAL